MINIKPTISLSILLLLFSTSAIADTLIKSFSGSGDQTTQPFSVAGEWEVEWTSDLDDFQLYLFSENGSGTGRNLRISSTTMGITATPLYFGKGTSFQNIGGDYYFKVNTKSTWHINIYQLDVETSVEKPERGGYKESQNRQNRIMPDKYEKQLIKPTPVYQKTSTIFTDKYQTNYLVKLHNLNDICFAIYKTSVLDNIIILFTNGITTKILDVSERSYKIQVLNYVGWIPERIITKQRK